jgi:hypothetical protein
MTGEKQMALSDNYRVRNVLSIDNVFPIEDEQRRFLVFYKLNVNEITELCEKFISENKIHVLKLPMRESVDVIELDKNLTDYVIDYKSAEIISGFPGQVNNVNNFVTEYKKYLSDNQINFHEVFYTYSEEAKEIVRKERFKPIGD